ncbi:MAG TPA: hypothetical protein EYN91_03905 [Candidatus Melainabacteria bacterium]|nr:hypothetical protein [Candidatus Melainabacteria bacterium]HIN67426.1 hypothetical protein [Candidatus Obscuribacterales bacterium]
MDESFKARLREVKASNEKLRQQSKQFWAQTDAKAYTVPQLIDRFLSSTDTFVPEELDDVRLRSFAEDCYEHLGWSGMCQAYEHIIAEELAYCPSMYHSWTLLGATVMNDAENLSFEERVRVAADVEAVFERASDDDCSWEKQIAYFYYDHPLKAVQPQFYLLKSKERFERAIESEDFNECDHHDVQVYGHVHFELGDFTTALHWYEKLEGLEHRCEEGCFLDRTLSERRLVECQQRLAD